MKRINTYSIRDIRRIRGKKKQHVVLLTKEATPSIKALRELASLNSCCSFLEWKKFNATDFTDVTD